MDNENALERVEAIFRDLFDQPDLSVQRSTTADSIEAWDSLSHVNLVAQVEAEFSIRFALGEIQSMTNVGEMLDLIADKQNS